MARSLRLLVKGGIYHVMNRGNNGEIIFREESDKELFLALVIEEIERCGLVLHDYALLDNHFHLLVETPEANLSGAMQRLQTTYAQRFNQKYRRTGHLFRGRFKSFIVEDGRYLMEVARYVVLNPVRAGIVKHPIEYRWTSYRAKAGYEEPPPWLSMAGLNHFDRDLQKAQVGYREFVDARLSCTEELLDNVVGQIVYGSEQFVQWAQALIDSEQRSEEHPRYQRDIGRPEISAIMGAVCERLGVTPEEVKVSRGHLSRTVFAMLGYWEGLRTLREIARELGLRSAGHVSSLVKRCRQQCRVDETLAQIVRDCRAAALAHAPPLPEHYRARQTI